MMTACSGDKTESPIRAMFWKGMVAAAGLLALLAIPAITLPGDVYAQNCSYVDSQLLWCPRDDRCIPCNETPPGQCYRASHAEKIVVGVCGACSPPCDLGVYSFSEKTDQHEFSVRDTDAKPRVFFGDTQTATRFGRQASPHIIGLLAVVLEGLPEAEAESGQYFAQHALTEKAVTELAGFLGEGRTVDAFEFYGQLTKRSDDELLGKLAGGSLYTEYIFSPQGESEFEAEFRTWYREGDDRSLQNSDLVAVSRLTLERSDGNRDLHVTSLDVDPSIDPLVQTRAAESDRR